MPAPPALVGTKEAESRDKISVSIDVCNSHFTNIRRFRVQLDIDIKKPCICFPESMSRMLSNLDLPQRIDTQRLILRLMHLDNVEQCKQVIQIYDAEGKRWGRGKQHTIEDVHRKHKAYGPKQIFCTRTAAPRQMYHLVFLKPLQADESEKLMGFVALSTRPNMPCPDIGYVLFEEHWHCGYASEAGKAVLQFWQDVVGIKEVFAGIPRTNIRSQRTAERIGFVRGGSAEFVVGTGCEEKRVPAEILILPGMNWTSYNEEGQTVRMFTTEESEIATARSREVGT